MADQIYRTVFSVEVLSDGPLILDGGDNDPFDLEAINWAITTGECVGSVEQVSTDVVPTGEVVSHLERLGSDATFFNRNEDDWAAAV